MCLLKPFSHPSLSCFWTFYFCMPGQCLSSDPSPDYTLHTPPFWCIVISFKSITVVTKLILYPVVCSVAPLPPCQFAEAFLLKGILYLWCTAVATHYIYSAIYFIVAEKYSLFRWKRWKHLWTRTSIWFVWFSNLKIVQLFYSMQIYIYIFREFKATVLSWLII